MSSVDNFFKWGISWRRIFKKKERGKCYKIYSQRRNSEAIAVEHSQGRG